LVGRGAIRIFTVLTVIAMCVYTTWSGWSMVMFARARAGLVSGQNRASEIRPWTDRAGLGGAALEAVVSAPIALSDAAAVGQRADDLAAILSGRPLSSSAWLSLAGVRLAGGEPFDDVLGALAMSSLTGANEGSLMMQRGIFGLFQWESLPSEARFRVIGDIAGAIRGTTVRDDEIEPARKLLATKAAQTRQEIAGLLRASGVPANELARMGL
jgi:hypothetical protein